MSPADAANTTQPPLWQCGWTAVPWACTALTILAQIAWPLTSGQARLTTTFLCVLTFAAASISHAAIFRGRRWAMGFVATTASVAFVVEFVGVHTGFPFSSYAYTPALGFRFAGVPFLILLAWLMAAYPAFVIACRLAHSRLAVALIGGFALTAWDFFLDPQMVGEAYWRWASTSPALPGVPAVPMLNYAGWFLSAAMLMSVLSRLPEPAAPKSVPASSWSRDVRMPEAVPALLWTWTWIGGLVGNVFFFDRPWVAFWGGLAMGAVTVPYLLDLKHEGQTRSVAAVASAAT